jgi:hypothetical protein
VNFLNELDFLNAYVGILKTNFPFKTFAAASRESSSGEFGRFLIQDDGSRESETRSMVIGEPGVMRVITLAMEPHQNDHYISAVNQDEDENRDDEKSIILQPPRHR